jgi:hypothetical protein
VDDGRLGAAVVDGDPDEDVPRRFLGVLDEDVEVAVLVEDPVSSSSYSNSSLPRPRLVSTSCA